MACHFKIQAENEGRLLYKLLYRPAKQVRKYKGKTLQVQVLQRGFAFDGQVFKSLSAVAKAITGSHCNGFWFFGLGQQGDH